jgi:hypothetical protein
VPDTDFLGTNVRTFGIILLARDRKEEPDEVANCLRVVGHEPGRRIRWWVWTGVVWRLDDEERASFPHFLGCVVWPDRHIEGVRSWLDREGAPPVTRTIRTIVTVNTVFAFIAVTMAQCKNVQAPEHQPSRQRRRFRERCENWGRGAQRAGKISPQDRCRSTTQPGAWSF